MQWRSLVLALLALRLAGQALLWLAGPSLGFYQQRFRPFSCSSSSGSRPAKEEEEAASASAASPNSRCLKPGGLVAPHWASFLGRAAWVGGSGGGPGSGSGSGWSAGPGAREGEEYDDYEQRYSRAFPPQLRAQLRDAARGMFAFGYDSYMEHAFPQDELNPIECRGRGPDRADPSNLNINDVLGNYSLTLIDALDTLAVMGNSSEFQKAVKLVIDTVSFDTDSTVQVFEATIRKFDFVKHVIITDARQPFGDMSIKGYDNELLHMAHDLAVRLLPAFENTKTGIPYPRVNLRTGVPSGSNNETCTAGAGSLLVEFGILSRLLGDSTFEWVARRACINEAIHILSFFPSSFLSFCFVLCQIIGYRTVWWSSVGHDAYQCCIHNNKSNLITAASYSLQHGFLHWVIMDITVPTFVSYLPFVVSFQVLIGDVEDAICLHAFYYAIWKRYGALPERYNWQLQAPDVLFYPLRPELVESTYLLYQATKNPFYLHVGMDILQSLEKHTKAKCGYATLHHVIEKSKEDRMESFFLSETCKYLYLLFDEENPVHKSGNRYMFTTEGHIVSLDKRLRVPLWQDTFPEEQKKVEKLKPDELRTINATSNCNRVPDERRYLLPLKSVYMRQIDQMVGLI
ncbi:hypothetical protein JRQ81_003141 [Phrynocephalus forsythii]|uniref:alpha-1,2-Mannosidase n=1 Tax=Phrynocephalus forsythii TaxID=171643 RepID=A0A9Q1AX61_9SAUR|nr:hypothetical protein JRQ81_003141 [Phrynocephalus forsythii]